MVPLSYRRWHMKTKKFYMIISIFFLAGAGMSGCGKMVKSAVVAEENAGKENATDASEGTKGKEASSRNALKTVPEQVQAPEIYETSRIEYLRSASREDKSSPLEFILTAEAPVEVPQVDSILLKRADKASGTEEMAEQMIRGIAAGKEIKISEEFSQENGGQSVRGNFTAGEIPYTYACNIGENRKSFSCLTDLSQVADTVEDLESWQAELFEKYAVDTGKVTGEEALEFLEGIGLQGFQICSEYHDTLPRDGKNGPVARDGFTFERVVDGVPVNYITESLLPVYEDGAASVIGDETAAEGEDLIWMQEELSIEFAGGTVRIFQYRDGLEISDLSDEKQFLLPFEEIRDIFERTVALQMMTEENRYSQTYADMSGVPIYNVDSVDMTVTKVKLGYMRQRDNLSNKKGFLIPVWDFYGVWTAELTSGSGIASSSMEADDFPILTLDARDGTVIQRFLGY